MNFAEVLGLLRTMDMELNIRTDPYLDATRFELRYKHGPYCRNGLIRNDVLKQADADEHVCYFITRMVKDLDEYAGISRAQEIMNETK